MTSPANGARQPAGGVVEPCEPIRQFLKERRRDVRIAAADPKARLGTAYQMPVIYAGNKDARPRIEETLRDKTALVMTENIRPILERENLRPARDKIHDLFLEHVMAQAPGYKKLMSWTGAPIMPTPVT